MFHDGFYDVWINDVVREDLVDVIVGEVFLFFGEFDELADFFLDFWGVDEWFVAFVFAAFVGGDSAVAVAESAMATATVAAAAAATRVAAQPTSTNRAAEAAPTTSGRSKTTPAASGPAMAK